MYRVLLFVALVGSAVAQIPRNESCYSRPTTTPLDLTRLAGTWYQIERTANSAELGDCSTSTYGVPTGNSGSLSNRWEISRQAYFNNGSYSRSNAETNPGRFNATFGSTTFTYHVLTADSNFTSYLLLHGCLDVAGNTSHVWAWKLSRSRTISTVGTLLINTVVGAHEDIRQAAWRTTRHDDTCGSAANLYMPPLFALISFFFICKKMI